MIWEHILLLGALIAVSYGQQTPNAGTFNEDQPGSLFAGTFAPVEGSCVPQSCCCSTGPVVATLTRTINGSMGVNLTGPVSGGHACFYQDQLSSVLTIQESGTTAMIDIIGQTITAMLAFDGNSLMITNSGSPQCRNVLKRVSGSTDTGAGTSAGSGIIPSISDNTSPNPDNNFNINSPNLDPQSPNPQNPNPINTAQPTNSTSELDPYIGLPTFSPMNYSHASPFDPISISSSSWVGVWEIDPHMCPTDDMMNEASIAMEMMTTTACCCHTGQFNILVDNEFLVINSIGNECILPSEYELLNLTLAEDLVSNFSVSLLNNNMLHFVNGSGGCSMVAKRPPILSNTTSSSDVNPQFTPTSTSTPTSTPELPQLEVNGSSNPSDPSDPEAPPTVSQGASQLWVGSYKSTKLCKPGPRCCCSRGLVEVQQAENATDMIYVSAGLDAGVACFRFDRLGGYCQVLNATHASCHGEQEYQGTLFQMNFTLNLSPDSQMLSVNNSFYPNCISVAARRSALSGGVSQFAMTAFSAILLGMIGAIYLSLGSTQ